VFGTDGVVFIDDHDYSVPHSVHANLFVDPATADRTITLHSTAEVTNDYHTLKHVGTANNVILAVGAGDYLDGVENGTLTIPPGGSVRIRAYTAAGGDLYWTTADHNFESFSETHTWAISGDVADGTEVAPGFYAVVGANESLTCVRVLGNIKSGTSIVCQLQDDGVNITGATVTADSDGADSGEITPVAVADGSYVTLDTSSGSGTPNGLTCTAVFRRTVVTRAA
jgi:hypothetical protein